MSLKGFLIDCYVKFKYRFRLRKLLLMLRLLKRFFEIKFFGKIHLKFVDFVFKGSKPFLPNSFRPLKKIIKNIKPHMNLVAITNSGTLLNKEKLLELKKLGVDTLTISQDS